MSIGSKAEVGRRKGPRARSVEERWRGEAERKEVMSSGGVFCLCFFFLFCFALLLFSIWSHLLILLDIFTMNMVPEHGFASFLKFFKNN